MNDHLSDFELDGVALTGAAPPHLAECADCTARLAAITEHSKAMKNSAAFARVSRSLEQVEPKKQSVSWLPWVGLATGLAVAASLVVVFRPGPADPSTERLKGSGDVVLIRSRRVLPSEPFKPGELVMMRVTPSPGATEVAVFSIDDGTHAVQQVWPEGDETAAIPPGGNLAELETTPGSMRLVAVFFDRHASTVDVAKEIEERGVEAAAATRSISVRHIEIAQ